MRRSTIVLLLPAALLLGPLAALRAADAPPGAAASVMPEVIAWRRDFHQHPELGNRELRTSKKVAEHLKSLKLEVRTGIAHTGVVGVLRGGRPGPVVALRADMDALPVTEQVELPFKSVATAEYRGETVGVMHACGHDGHTAILMGAASVLAAMRDTLPGTVVFVFQPAEEGAPDGERGGAPLMLDEGVFGALKPDAVFGLHLWSALNSGQIGYRSGPMMAGSDRFRIVVTGKQTHGARPWGGVDPIVTAAQIVLGLQSIVSRQTDITRAPAVISVGAIKGGIRFNIIPDTVEMVGTMRTFDKGVRQESIERITRTANGIASAAGATATVEFGNAPNSVLVNDPSLTERMLPTLRKAAPQGVVELPYSTVSEDFSAFADRYPGLYFFVGITPPSEDAAAAPSNHSPKFYIDESGLATGLEALLGVTLAYLSGGAG